MEMDFVNNSATPITSLAVQFNKNAFSLSPANQAINFAAPIMPGR